MKTHGLTQYYDRLKVWERIRLLFAARARGDEADEAVLFSSSPISTCNLPEHLMPEQVLHVMALMYVGEQLDAAAHYFFALWRADDPEDPDPSEWLRAAQADARFFTANADAWRRFCTERDLSAADLVAANHRGKFLRYCEEHMPANDSSTASLESWPREARWDTTEIVTADKLLESWRTVLHTINPHAP